MKGLTGLILIVGGLIFMAQACVIGSAITSAVKAVSGNCGHRYPVEAIFYGNWFCPSESQP